MKRQKTVSFALSTLLFACTAFSGCSLSDFFGKSSESEGSSVEGSVIDNGTIEDMTDWEFTYSQLVGTDAEGRSVSPVTTLNDKYIGVYYFIAHGYHGDAYGNIEEFLDKYGRLKSQDEFASYEEWAAYRDNYVNTNPLFQTTGDYYSSECPMNMQYYWDEPLYGYYDSGDEWVLRRHLELMALSGVDFLLLDYTNLVLYEENTYTLLNAVKDMLKSGVEVPKITMMLPFDSAYSLQCVEKCWQLFFSKEEYSECWFYGDSTINPKEKPMVVGNFISVADPVLHENLWLKPLQWPGQATNDDALPWIDWDILQHNHNGIMSVSASQATCIQSDAYLYPDYCVVRGRGWTYDCEGPGNELDAVMKGANYQQQWDYVMSRLSGDVYMVIQSCWNEWGQAKYDFVQREYWTSPQQGFWSDLFNSEYSRDLEMTTGKLGDNYYMHSAINAKAFKNGGETSVLATFEKKTLDVSKTDAWSVVKYKYLDAVGDAFVRDYKGYNDAERYYDDSARNDIASVKIANDGEYLYVLAECADVLVYEAGDNNFMNLYIDTGKGGWENYGFVINRSFDLASHTSLIEKFTGNGSEVKKVGNAETYVFEKAIAYKIPLSLLGMSANDAIGVKVTDNLQKFGEVNDFYISGDSAPIGRLNYGYKIV